MYVAIAGNIGSGKTSLTNLLCEHLNWQAALESVDDNPYLKDFYGDMQRWAFHLQVFFLNSRFNQVRKIAAKEGIIIQDRSIYEDAYIFAKNLYQSKLIDKRDFDNYNTLFHTMLEYVTPPRLLIYLKAEIPQLLQQIRKRGRDFEKDIPVEYLENLNLLYNEWIDNYNNGPLLVIDMADYDFVNNSADFDKILNQVKQSLDVELPL